MIAYGVPSPLLLANGSGTNPTFSFAAEPGMGVYRVGGGQLGFATSNAHRATLDGSAGWYLGDNSALIAMGASADLIITRDAANVFAQRRTTNAQTYRIYNTFTDAANYERGALTWSANVLNLLTEQGGTGTARSLRVGTSGSAALQFRTNGVDNWQISSSGHLIATDNTFDIGASGATRPRTIYVGTQIVIGTNPSTVGDLALPNGGSIYFRNFANSANIAAIGVTGANIITVGQTTNDAVLVNASSGGTLGFFGATPVVRQTYGAPTGTATRTTFATGTVTTAQLAERVKAMIDDLRSFGLFA